MIWGIVVVVAAQLTPLPCARWQEAWRRDEKSPQDSSLRAAATYAEAAGDVDEARDLLRLLTQRSTDEAVRAEAFDALSSLKRGDSVACRAPARRSVLLVVDDGTGMDAAARDALAHAIDDELGTDGVDVERTTKDACRADERCWRKLLTEEAAVAAIVVVPTRVGPVTDVDVTVYGFVAKHHARADDDFPKASAAAIRDFVDDAAVSGVAVAAGASPVVGAVVVGASVVVGVAGGAVALVEWPVRDDPNALQTDRDRANVTSVVGLVAAAAGVVGLVVGGVLLATSTP